MLMRMRYIFTVSDIVLSMPTRSLLAIRFPFSRWWRSVSFIMASAPAQLAPYVYNVIKMLSKFAELVGVEVTVRHLVHQFAPGFYIGTMVNLRHRGSKCLVVRMDNKGSHQFCLGYFYVKIEAVVANADGFPEAWNHTRKCPNFFYF